MTTNAAYIPVVGNFDPAKGFRFINSVGDNIVPQPVPTFGPGRPGRAKFGLTLILGGGPVGDDVSFKLRIPYPYKFDPVVLATNQNAYFPTSSLVPSRPGATAQDLFVFQVSLDPVLNTFELELQFGNPQPILYVASVYIDFGFSETE